MENTINTQVQKSDDGTKYYKAKSLSIENQDGASKGSLDSTLSAPDNYADCKVNNAIYSDEQNQVYAHLVYTPVTEEEMNAKNSTLTSEAGRYNLQNYLLVISTFNPEKFNDVLGKLIAEYCFK